MFSSVATAYLGARGPDVFNASRRAWYSSRERLSFVGLWASLMRRLAKPKRLCAALGNCCLLQSLVGASNIIDTSRSTMRRKGREKKPQDQRSSRMKAREEAWFSEEVIPKMMSAGLERHTEM